MNAADAVNRGAARSVHLTPISRVARKLGPNSVVALTLACTSDHSAAPAGRVDVVPASVGSAAELAKSYGLEIRPEVVDGVPIRVVDAASGQPVADALVVSVNEAEFTYWVAGDGGITWNARNLLLHSGEAHQTSRDGVARLAAPTEPRSIFVWHGNDFGRTTLEVYDRAEHVVSVAPRALMVEVVDKNGKPQQGVPIQLSKCALEPMSLGTTVGFTDADGRFAIPPLELERAVHRSCGRRALVMLGYLVSGYELRAIDAPELEPVKFVLPDCGDVEFDLQTSHPWPPSDHRTSWPQFRLSIEGTKQGQPCGRKRAFETMSERTLLLPIDHPPYRLEHVEVGTTLWFRLNVQLSESTSTSDEVTAFGADGRSTKRVDGPSQAGERRHVLLKAGALGAPLEEWSSENETNPDVKRTQAEADAAHQAEVKEFQEKLRVSSSIDVSVLLDVPIEPCSLSVRLDDNHEPNEHDSCPWIDVNGRATMRGVPAGRHSVTITERRMSNDYADVPLCRIDDVDVGPSQHVRDPRLLNIDLRRKLRVHRLEVTNGDGHPLSGFIRFTRDGDRDFHDETWFENGHVAFLTGVDDGVRASVAVSRCRKLALDLTSSESVGKPRRVFMERGIGVHLSLDRSLKLPDAPHDSIYIGVSEMPHWCETLEDLRTVALRPGADLNFRLAEPGDWKVIFLRSHDDGSGEPVVSECSPVETTISVEDAADNAVQLLSVKPDADRWNELLNSLNFGN